MGNALIRLGEAYDKKGFHSKATQAYERAAIEYKHALDKKPDDRMLMSCLGKMHALLGRIDEGIALLKKAI